jgi:asparagine synthase (glutamine-hydrolysing)
MSGTVGIWNINGEPIEPQALQQMAAAIAYRGADGIFYAHADNVGFAFLHLNTGWDANEEQQPLVSDGCWLNGDVRLDNRTDLLQMLHRAGVYPQGKSDPALLLAAYELWGCDCLHHIIGDFAFAIWDSVRKRLFCARDQMGCRPLYYTLLNNKSFLWGSEVAALLGHPAVHPKLNEQTIGLFLAAGINDNETFFENIFSIPSAHFLLLDVEDNVRPRLSIQRYWDINPEKQIRYKDSQQYAEHFGQIFREAVACRLHTRFPTGVLLSGGRDSASVTCVAADIVQNQPQPDSAPNLQTFTWGCDTFLSSDEREYSGAVNEKYDLTSHRLIADGPDGAWPLSGDWLRTSRPDTPYETVSQPMYERLLKMASVQGVKVVLSGVPGDALVGGWNFLYFKELTRKFRVIALAKELSHLQHTLNHYQAIWPEFKRTPVYKEAIRHLIPAPLLTMWRLYQSVRSTQSNTLGFIHPLFAQRIQLEERLAQRVHPAHYSDPMKEVRYQKVFNRLDAYLVNWLEHLMARAQLETRSPWFDIRLVEFVLAIPEVEISRGAEARRLISGSMKGVLPEKVRLRVGKKFPSELYERSIREWEWAKVEYLLENPLIEARGYVPSGQLHKWFSQYRSGLTTMSNRLIAALLLEKWMRTNEL